MGDLQAGENFQDRCQLIIIATGAVATGLADVTCTIIDELGNSSAGTVAEIGATGEYKCTDFTPDAVGTWSTHWGKTANPENYYFYTAHKIFKVGGGEVTDIMTNTDVATSTRAASATALSTAIWTNARAAFLDKVRKRQGQ